MILQLNINMPWNTSNGQLVRIVGNKDKMIIIAMEISIKQRLSSLMGNIGARATDDVLRNAATVAMPLLRSVLEHAIHSPKRTAQERTINRRSVSISSHGRH